MLQRSLERLVDRGHEVTVLTADAGNKGNHVERRNGVQIRRYRSIAPNETIHFSPQIATAVRRSNASIVHAHNYHSFPLFFAALGVGDRQFVVTTHYHGGSASPVRDRLLSVYHPFGLWAVRRADSVIAVSEWERKQLATDFGVTATVIPNGLEIKRFSEAEPIEYNRPYLLSVGRLEEYKGIQYVIRAMSQLPEYDLLVVGSGSYREELERITREEGINEQVKFLGYVDDKQLPPLYVGAEMYVTMSEFEAYGMTVAEALAAGTPCVVRETGGLKDWVSQEGVIGIDDPDSNQIVEVISQQEATVTPHISSWNQITKRIEELYR